MKEDTFSYVIGRYWNPGKNSSVAAYSEFSNEVFFGTHREANLHCYRINKSTKTENKYQVFRLVPISSIGLNG